jgi:hypothetical protein
MTRVIVLLTLVFAPVAPVSPAFAQALVSVVKATPLQRLLFIGSAVLIAACATTGTNIGKANILATDSFSKNEFIFLTIEVIPCLCFYLTM